VQILSLNGNGFDKAKTIFAKVVLTLLYIAFPPCWLLAFFGCGLYGRVFKNKVTSFFNRYIVPPIAVVGLFFYVFAENNIYPFGRKTIAWCDLTQQGVPYWMNFKNVLEGADDFFLNMGNAAGMNGVTLTRSFFFFPFNYLALLFERGSMMQAVTVVLVLKFAACSVTAMVFFKIACKKLHPSLAVALSLMYSFCAYGLMFYQIINWPDIMYITPLYFAGVYLLVTKGKIALYSISLAYVMNNVPFGFMTILATILFFGYYCIVNRNKSESGKYECHKVAINFVIGSAFAAMLCAFKWVNFFDTFGSSARGVKLEDTLPDKKFFTRYDTLHPLLMSTAFIFVSALSFKRYNKKPIEKACMYVFGMMLIAVMLEPINTMWHGGSYMSFPGRYVYILIFLGLAIAGILLSRNNSENDFSTLPTSQNKLETNLSLNKRLALTLGVCSVFPLLYLYQGIFGEDKGTLSLLSIVVYVFIFFALIGCSAILLFRCRKETSEFNSGISDFKKSKFHTILLNLGSCFALYTIFRYLLVRILVYMKLNINALDKYSTSLWGDSSSYKHTLVLFAGFIFLYAIGYAFYRWKLISKHVLAFVLVITMGFEAYCALNIYVVPPSTKVNTESFQLYADLADRIEDEDFYRVKNEGKLGALYNSEANMPGAIGYKSMGHYSSLASETYLYFAKALGYSSMWMKIESFGGTKFSDALMSIKYSIRKNNKSEDVVYSNKKFQIEENEYYLPLGIFSYDDEIDVDLNRISRIDLQELIYDSFTNDKYNLFEEQTPKASGCTYKSRYDSQDNEYHISPQSGKTATLEYNIKISGTKTLYFDCFDEFSNDLSEKIYNAFSIHVNGKKIKSKYPVDSSNGILNLGTFTNTTVTVKLGVLEKVACRSFGVYTMDDDLLNETISEIKTAALTLDGNEVYGSYDAKEDGEIIISIPHGGGFECTVNGKTVKLGKAYGGLISVPVTMGKNEIKLTYVPTLFYEGVYITIFGIILGIVVLVIMRKKKYATVYDGVYALMGDKGTNTLGLIFKVCTVIAMIVVLLAIYVYPMLLKLSNYTEAALGK